MVGMSVYENDISPTTRNTQQLDKLDPNKMKVKEKVKAIPVTGPGGP
jgi:hypothetical protein